MSKVACCWGWKTGQVRGLLQLPAPFDAGRIFLFFLTFYLFIIILFYFIFLRAEQRAFEVISRNRNQRNRNSRSIEYVMTSRGEKTRNVLRRKKRINIANNLLCKCTRRKTPAATGI